MDTTEVRIPVNKIKQFGVGTMVNLGVPDQDAEIIITKILEADLRGITSHGVVRLPIYVKNYKDGLISAKPNIRKINDQKATALIDGDNGLGHIVSATAMNVAIEKAAEYGISGVGVYNTNHNGALINYCMTALKHDMIGFFLHQQGRNHMAPWGGTTRLIGNNPFAVAVPAGDEKPIAFDAATSTVARGWILLAEKNKVKIPLNWAFDVNGEPTDDAEKALKGSITPLGYSDGVGYKGLGISILISCLAGALTGANIGADVIDGYPKNEYKNNGHFMGCIKIDHFMPLEKFKSRVDKFIREIKSSDKRVGVDRIYLPGEKEAEKYEENLQKGIPVGPGVLKELNDLGLSAYWKP